MRRLIPIILALGLTTPVQALNAEDFVRASLLDGWTAEDGQHMAGLRLQLSPGWKTYWRAPGEGGIPPMFDWSGSQNVDGVRIYWPTPEVFDQNGIRSIGYSGDVTIPIGIAAERAGDEIMLDGRVEIGLCRDVCIPVTLRIAAPLPSGGAGERIIRAALDDRPISASQAGVASVICRFEPISDGMRLTISIEMPSLGPAEATVIEFADPTVWVSEAAATRSGGTLTSVADLVPAHAGPFAVSREDVRVTVLAGGRGVDIQGCQVS